MAFDGRSIGAELPTLAVRWAPPQEAIEANLVDDTRMGMPRAAL
jgi:hypothetical protein